jgi:hypothetical protein
MTRSNKPNYLRYSGTTPISLTNETKGMRLFVQESGCHYDFRASLSPSDPCSFLPVDQKIPSRKLIWQELLEVVVCPFLEFAIYGFRPRISFLLSRGLSILLKIIQIGAMQ